MSLTGRRVESWRYDLLDLTNQKVGALHVEGGAGGQIDRSTQSRPQSSGTITVTPDTDVDWLTHRVRIWYRDGDQEYPLLTAIPKVPGDSYTPTGHTQTVQLYDLTQALEDDRPGASYTVPAGANAVAAAAAVIASTGELGAVLEPSTATLSAAMSWDSSVTKLTIVNDLLDAAGYFALYADELGRLRGVPYTLPAARPTAYSFSGSTDNLYSPTWEREADTSSVPNALTCVSVARSNGKTWTSTAEDNTAGRFSIPSRGRRIAAETQTDVAATSQAALDTITQRKLTEAQQVGASYRISHPWLPFGLNSVIEATFPRRSETVRGSVRSQTIPLGQPGALVSTTFSVTEG